MTDNEARGLIFNIQRFSLHDGPGIRTIVFLKGCPLACKWCSNPESQAAHAEVMTSDKKCVRCGRCAGVCPEKAITLDSAGRRIDRSRCSACGGCARVCPAGALEVVGTSHTVSEVMADIEKDRLFYQNSDGGVTLSGGEPLLQCDFALELARESRARGLHVALETCGQAAWDVVDKVLQHVDLVLYDIKQMAPAKHKEATGAPNDLILENARRVSSRKRTWLRYPVIPGYNDSETQVMDLAAFATSCSFEKVSLLPYHALGEPKYQRLNRVYPMGAALPPAKERLEDLRLLMESRGLTATIGY